MSKRERAARRTGAGGAGTTLLDATPRVHVQEIAHKTCPRCGAQKPADAYYAKVWTDRRKTRHVVRHGLSSYCKKCTSAVHMAHRPPGAVRLRFAAERPEDLPVAKWCPGCAAAVPRSAFRVQQRRRRDGTSYYQMLRYCRDHERVRARAWREAGPAVRERRAWRAARDHAKQERERQEAARAQDRARRKAACIDFVQRYVAGLWERDPGWLLGRSRAPEPVEARALVVAILHREHGLRITAAARAIARDHSTALYLLATYEPQPAFAALIADYRLLREQRRAARAQRDHSARKAG